MKLSEFCSENIPKIR